MMRADPRAIPFALALALASMPAGGAGAETPDGSDGPADLLHAPPSQTERGQPLRLVAVVGGEWTPDELLLRYRAASAAAGGYGEIRFERTAAGGYGAMIPATEVEGPALEYYITARGPGGEETLRFASPEAPHQVQVTVPAKERWVEAERRRLGGHMSQIDVEARAMQFGNRFGHDDYFARGELSFTHRLLTVLYSIRLGYGMIEGETPTGRDEMSRPVRRGGRYGFGEVRLRLHESVWVDGRAAVGFDRDGFIVGGGGKVTLGTPWRSAVEVGADFFEGLRGTLWLRLQWDTVPPLLMGASIARTDLPGAVVENGSYVSYDARYPVTDRFLVGGWVAAGTRDGPTRFGGGLDTSMRF